jgi:hypothetical protein
VDKKNKKEQRRKMTETELSDSAKRIADAVMRGEYGSIISDAESEEPESDAYAGWGNLKNVNKKKFAIILGAVLGAALIAGAVGGGVYYWKKHRSTS